MAHIIVIAEAGVNHNGDIRLAKQLIDIADEAGVDYVKFQTFNSESLVSRNANCADYQKKNIGEECSQLEMLRKLELSHTDHHQLIDYCKTKRVKFLSTAFDIESISFLASLNLGVWKIPSGDITNYPYLREIAKQNQPVILSTGMCQPQEIEEAIATLVDFGLSRSKITLLHCNTQYPTPMCDVNLSAMQTIGKYFNLPYGYSDHTQGIEVPIAAVALGASVVEKHFTIDRNMKGPDHKASLEPDELKAMVLAIRNIELAIGSPEKKPSPSELANIAVARKSIIATKAIEKGETLDENNITTKRPGTGISPMKWNEVIGTQAIRDFGADELIEIE